MVNTDVPLPVTVDGLKLAVVWLGHPLRLNVTVPAYPPLGVIVAVSWATLLPWAPTRTEVGVAVVEKSEVAKRPKTLSNVCVPTYTFPLATVGTVNFTAGPGLSRAPFWPVL
jgi:hypothetical protein